MNYYGDIPQEHLELLKELRTLETWFTEHGSTVPPLQAAQGFVAMAHDLYIMNMEEDGERLLREADKHFPGYFKKLIYTHMARNDDFDYLVTNLTQTMAIDVMRTLGFGE